MNWIQPGKLQRLIYPDATWRVNTQDKVIYLTFDDGPTETVTEWVLAQLDSFGAKATFFCIGKNIEANPDLFLEIKAAGHITANHTFNHEKGWAFATEQYLESVAVCDVFLDNKLFRPPYGKMTPSQYLKLRKTHQIVMWDVLSYDYDQHISTAYSLNKSIELTRKGSIVVFHDSIKAFPKLRKMLPYYLDYFSKKGYSFETLNSAFN
jgi:peptidoglycan/xylan/chitin deacetylase (PgdA/CDA1 family)